MGGTMDGGAPPTWQAPAAAEFTVDDLLTRGDLPPYPELLDGRFSVRSPQQLFHADAVDLLVTGLRRSVPAEARVRREMTVVLDRRNGPEPDVSVVRAEAVGNWDLTHFRAADVLLAIHIDLADIDNL
ncbi:Uma2 family endonuclease [Streptomyces sp. NPDC054802]